MEGFVLNKRDTFVILPTGYGKSIIYGVLPMTFDFMRGKSNLPIKLFKTLK